MLVKSCSDLVLFCWRRCLLSTVIRWHLTSWCGHATRGSVLRYQVQRKDHCICDRWERLGLTIQADTAEHASTVDGIGARSVCIIKATPTIVGEAFIFYLWTFFLSRTYIAARRRSGASSKVYQWLGPRCRQKVTRKNFANRPPNLYRGEKVRNLASILKISRLWRALVSKRSNISEMQNMSPERRWLL